MPRDGTATRQRILDTAERLVIENGFAATAVDTVIAESHSSKGAFFHHFPTKVDLARALVSRYVEADIAHLHRALAQVSAGSDDPAEQLVAFLALFEDEADELMAAQSSCLYVSVLAERQLSEAGTRAQILQAVTAWRDALAALIRRAQQVRPALRPLDPEALADHVFVTFEGAFILSRSTDDASQMRAQLGILRGLLQALLPPSPDHSPGDVTTAPLRSSPH